MVDVLRIELNLLFCGLFLAMPAGAQGGDQPPDPTVPLARPAQELARSLTQESTRFTLQATLVSEDRKLAIINGRTYHEGAKIGGRTVIEIQRGRVTLAAKDNSRVLHLVSVKVREISEAGKNE